MGLDMYLSTSKGEEVGYWRKANQIHNWFVKNCQDGIDECQETLVTKEQLAVLLNICNHVLASCSLKSGKIINGWTWERSEKIPIIEDGEIIENPKIAQELLPTQEGFFFGGTDYDQYYYTDIEDTIKILEEAMGYPDGTMFVYQSSW